MTLRTVRTLAFGVPLLLLAALSTASAQYPSHAPQQGSGGYPVQQAYYGPTNPNAPGMVAPVGFQGGCASGACGPGGFGASACGPAGCGPASCGSFGGDCYGGACGYGGYADACGFDGCGGHGAIGPVGRFFYYLFTAHGPQGDGAYCRPRFFDIQFEVVTFQREEVSGESIGFYSDGFTASPPDIVLSTDDLEFDTDVGVSLVGNYMISANTFVEVRWLGAFEQSTSASINSVEATGMPNNLFSAFSEFGTNPNNPMQIGFPEVDAASEASISLNARLDSGEINLRRRWVSNNCFFHYSLFMGARYIRFDETFNLAATVRDANQVVTGAIDYEVRANNDLTGFQLGGDLLFNITKRIRVGGDLKAGIFGNQSVTFADILTQEEDPNDPGTLIDTNITERNQKAEAAFAGEASLFALIYLTDRWTLRGGYEVFYLNNVALGAENFNSNSTLLVGDGSREPFINNTGDAFYHGFTGGFEFTW